MTTHDAPSFSAVAVVLAWAGLNTLLASLLAAFIAAGLGGGFGRGAGAFPVIVYAAASFLVFLIALAVWVARRRVPDAGPPTAMEAGVVRPRRPGRPLPVLLLAVGVVLIWLGLSFGKWLSIVAIAPLLASLMMELAARRRT